MKSIFLILSLSFLNIASAQYSNEMDMVLRCKKILKNKTYIVLYENESYNNAIKEAVNKQWNLTEFEFLPASELSVKIQSPNYNFILLCKVPVIENKDYWTLSFIAGGTTSVHSIQFSDLLAYAPIDYLNRESDIYHISYRLDFIIQSLQYTVNILKTRNIKTNSIEGTIKFLEDHYRLGRERIKSDTLIINEANFEAGITAISFQKEFPKQPFKVVDEETFENLVQAHPNYPRYSFLFVIQNDKNTFMQIINARGFINSADRYTFFNPKKKLPVKQLNSLF